MGANGLAAAEYQSVLSKASAGVPNYDKLKLTTARYVFGQKFMDLKRADLALPQFFASIEDSRTAPRERVLSHLHAGQVLDLLGRRAEAVAQYRAVLALKDIERSHRHAKMFIERPYAASGQGPKN